MFRRFRFYRRPIYMRRPLWRPFWARPLGCGMGLLIPACLFGMLLLALIARR